MTYKLPIITASVFAAGLATCLAAEDLLIADFEGKDYGNWKTTGEAFGPGPAQGSLPGQMAVSGFVGKGLVNSFFKGDGTTGTLTSPEFKIGRKYIIFLIGGGMDPENTSMNLVIDGKIVRIATGPNDRPGGSEALIPGAWDVTEFAGKSAVIRVVDNATGGWGHVSVDQIVQTDAKPAAGAIKTPPAPQVANPKREIKIDKRYLNLPIKDGARNHPVSILVDGKLVMTNDIGLADGAPDWWAFVDAGEVAFTVRGANIVYDVKKQELVVNGHRAPAPMSGGKQSLRIYCDRTGLEVFASGGLTYVPMPFQPKPGDLNLTVSVKSGDVRFSTLQVHELRTAWE